MHNQPFRVSLAHGQEGENQIARWIAATFGAVISPVYETQVDTGKGPRVFAGHRSWVAPDLLCLSLARPLILPATGKVLSPGQVVWVEAKRKTHFTWHYVSGTWQTGIDLRHYLDYLDLARFTGWPVWLLFLHTDARPARNHATMPANCPVGLFGHRLDHLAGCEHHRDGYEARNGRSYPMVYWRHRDLIRMASLEEVTSATVTLRRDLPSIGAPQPSSAVAS